MIDVVSAVIARKGRLLLAQRRWDQDYPFTWESCGGKVDSDETHETALRRELMEEVYLRRLAIRRTPLGVSEIPREDSEVCRVTFYLVGIGAQTPRPQEGQGLGWFLPAEVRQLVLTPANAAMLERILSVIV